MTTLTASAMTPVIYCTVYISHLTMTLSFHSCTYYGTTGHYNVTGTGSRMRPVYVQ